MVIEELFSEYVQKSRMFLYPLLGIKRGGSVTPIETYVSWKGRYDITDYKLVCLYHLRDDVEFMSFEKNVLLNNPLFHDFKQVSDKDGIYIFDFTSVKEDWNEVILGRYSRISSKSKKQILGFFENAGKSYSYIESYLYPEKFYTIYAKILSEVKDRKEMDESLRYAIELCDKPNWSAEEIIIDIKNLEIRKEIS